MNRRGFLQSCLALVAAPAVPAPAAIGLLAERPLTHHLSSLTFDRETGATVWGSFGTIRNVRVWNRALTNDEIRRITA